jgi:ubiquinone/menaquinone biosynthesis C-methylase UbiE
MGKKKSVHSVPSIAATRAVIGCGAYRWAMVNEAHEKSRATWDEMAPGWDRYGAFMRETTEHVSHWLVKHLGAREGDTILDLAAGPGDNGFLAAPTVGASGRIMSTDFAPRMVEVARQHAQDLGLSNVDARVLDAERMDLEDDSIDGIVCRWGFMLMFDPEAALSECRRVLKEGRRLVFSVWGRPEQNPWVTVTGMTMIQLGYQPGGDPFGPGGMFSMMEHGTIRSMTTGAGFLSTEIQEMPVDWTYESFAHAWEFMTQVAGAIAALVKTLPPDEVERLRAALQNNVAQYRTEDGGITLPGKTINVVTS